MSRQRTTVSTCRKLWLGVQSRFSVLTQISPVVYLMFGWKIFVTKKPERGSASERQGAR